jgi:hypothetical protein
MGGSLGTGAWEGKGREAWDGSLGTGAWDGSLGTGAWDGKLEVAWGRGFGEEPARPLRPPPQYPSSFPFPSSW